MTPEEKELLLKNLCTRLSYGVQIYCEKGESKFNFTLYGIRGKMLISKITYEEKTYLKGIVSKHFEYPIYSNFLKIICKPYLRPLSSMTEEEKKEFVEFIAWTFACDYQANTLEGVLSGNEIKTDLIVELFDWLNAHHFDYRGLIEKGLALEAPEGMYKIE